MISARPTRLRAFTLVEAITTIAIVGVVGSIAVTLVRTAIDVYEDSAIRADLSTQLSTAMERVATELRTIGPSSASGSVGPDISALTSTSITFNSGAAARTITRTGSNLLLTGGAASNIPLAQNVSTFTLQGYDKSNVALPASPSAGQIATLRRIEITLTATRGTVSETLRTRVFIRPLAAGSGAP